MNKPKIIIALDFDNEEKTMNFLNQFDQKLFVKVGMELFYKYGPNIIDEIKSIGHYVFLDLKLYDIPTTVRKSIVSLNSLNVDMLTIHTSGGQQMLQEAQQEAQKNNLNLLGVTILTSQSKDQIIKTDFNLDDVILDLAQKANDVNMFGIVCSAQDIPNLKKKLKNINLKFVTPGIRNENDSTDDQKRIMTPKEAIKNGSDFLVVGRPITKANNPVDVYKKMIKDIEE